MTLVNAMASLADVLVVLEKAVEAEKGIILKFESHAERHNFRQKCYQVRTADRKENAKIYEVGEPGHNKSEFDFLRLENINVEEELGFHLKLVNVKRLTIRMYDPDTGELMT